MSESTTDSSYFLYFFLFLSILTFLYTFLKGVVSKTDWITWLTKIELVALDLSIRANLSYCPSINMGRRSYFSTLCRLGLLKSWDQGFTSDQFIQNIWEWGPGISIFFKFPRWFQSTIKVKTSGLRKVFLFKIYF